MQFNPNFINSKNKKIFYTDYKNNKPVVLYYFLEKSVIYLLFLHPVKNENETD